MSDLIMLVRHTEVALAWKGRCYGRSDMGLSRAGLRHAKDLAAELAQWQADVIVHSGLCRARLLAEAIATRADTPIIVDSHWQERDFGTWEGRSWTSIYRETGNAMDGMIDDPEGFRPGGGETTTELAARALAAFHDLPAGRVLVVTHGGPIAAIVGTLQTASIRDWPKLVPATGEWVELKRPGQWDTRRRSPERQP
jgi:broad specificity phosphatase PhoE